MAGETPDTGSTDDLLSKLEIFPATYLGAVSAAALLVLYLVKEDAYGAETVDGMCQGDKVKNPKCQTRRTNVNIAMLGFGLVLAVALVGSYRANQRRTIDSVYATS